MAEKHIAIVGAGPKAAAIAAKADTLNRCSKAKLRISIFDEQGAGANWTGLNGYTDGEARLCTPAERDLGFPYDAGVFDKRIATDMFGEYSWGAYLLDKGRSDARSGYNNWVNRGRLRPTHAEFADYVAWAIGKSEAVLDVGRVTRVEETSQGWRVVRRTAKGGYRTQGYFHGIVFTGPGPSRRIPLSGASARVSNGTDFWREADAFLGQAQGVDEPVVILGAGGTAAAIAARAVRARPAREIIVLGDQAALFTRSEAFFENQIFTDDALWERLLPATRREVADRLNRGVVWATISDELARSPRVRFEPGRGKAITVQNGVDGEELVVTYESSGVACRIYASLVIDAAGFDPWWFVPLLPPRLRDQLLAADSEVQKTMRGACAEAMSDSLCLFDDGAGPVHAPMLSQAVGPGFLSLMVLGAMSDRILGRYYP